MVAVVWVVDLLWRISSPILVPTLHMHTQAHLHVRISLTHPKKLIDMVTAEKLTACWLMLHFKINDLLNQSHLFELCKLSHTGRKLYVQCIQCVCVCLQTPVDMCGLCLCITWSNNHMTITLWWPHKFLPRSENRLPDATVVTRHVLQVVFRPCSNNLMLYFWNMHAFTFLIVLR